MIFGTTIGVAQGNQPLPALERISIQCRQTENREITKASLRKRKIVYHKEFMRTHVNRGRVPSDHTTNSVTYRLIGGESGTIFLDQLQNEARPTQQVSGFFRHSIHHRAFV